ncbi:PAS domain-containing sensor histidine kinase [Desulfospira joergensenii]|uniref:PAS domain-containing sensor histidine kinase n=1 Tax=Desulfospira joergensenii TaxID=53329 RepID=UPI0003B48006|nr:PAS domain-containing sensor histidine kinase [Desulfospira joergensenii]
MNSKKRTKDQLLEEVTRLRTEIKELKKAELDFKQTKKELTEQRRLYLDFTNSLPGGIYRIRVFPSGKSDETWQDTEDAPYEFEFVNDGFCEILKVSRQVAENNPALLVSRVVDEDRPGFARMNSKANQEMSPFLWEGRLLIEGEITWIHFESIPMPLENGEIIWTGMLYDITEHKKTEQALKIKTKALSKANAEKDKFFSIVAHDLRSPLSSISGLSRILCQEIQNKNFEKVEAYSEMIHQTSQNSVDLLMNLMEWSQSQTGMMKYNPGHMELKDIMEENIFIFTDIAEQKSIILTSDLSSEIPIYADKDMMSTIVRNLVSNAVKFTEPGGEINISARIDKDKVIVSIKDTGIGMSESFIEKIFTIGENCSTPGTQNETGTGLGLVLCREFIEKHQGEIWVESMPGKGSAFYFTIPGHPDMD